MVFIQCKLKIAASLQKSFRINILRIINKNCYFQKVKFFCWQLSNAPHICVMCSWILPSVFGDRLYLQLFYQDFKSFICVTLAL